MATRTAQVVIQVDDKSLVELNAEIKTLEASIKNLKIGTTEWVAQNQKLGVLKGRFQEVTEEAKKLQGQMTKVTGSDQIRAIAKLGTGMVGAFASANGALTLLTGNKAFDEITAKATSLMQVMGGLNQIAELFSKQTMTGLASIGAGFKGLTSTVKGFSTATKAALISTGIGALIAGLGLVIANWDKIKGAISGGSSAEKKYLEDSQKGREAVIKQLEAEQKLLEDRKKAIEEANKFIGKGNQEEATRIVNNLIKNQNELLNENIQKNNDRLKQLDIEIKKAETSLKANEMSRKAIEGDPNQLTITFKILDKRIALGKLNIESLKKEKENTEAINENLLKQNELNNDLYDNRQKALISAQDYINATEKIIKNNEAELAIVNSLKDSEQQRFELQRSNLYQQINAIEKIRKEGGTLTKDEEAQVKLLNSQITALENQNELRINNEKLALKQVEDSAMELVNQKLINDELSDIELKYININEENKKRSDELDHISNSLESEVKTIEGFQKKYEDVLKFERQLYETRKITTDDIVENLKTELGYFITIQDKTREKLDNEKLILENQLKINEAKIQEKNDTIAVYGEQYKINELEKERLEKELLGVGKDPYLSRLEKQQKILDLQAQINKLDTDNKNIIKEITVANNEITDSKNENLKVSTEISGVEKDINKTVTDTQDKTVETTLEIQKQLKLYKRLQNFLGNYAEEIQAVVDILNQSIELVATVFDSAAQRHQEEIDALQVQYDEMNNAEADRQDRLLAYEEELKDANGDRYDELLSLIDQEKAAKDANFVSEVDQKNKLAELEHKKLLDERKAAQWRKAQSIIDALIQGALAVIKALPNIFLSVAVGILAAAGVATIAAQKIPDVPPQEKFEKGGFTRKGKNKDVAGIVHANEYVIPADVVGSSKAQHHIAALERQRVRGYAEGGFVAPANSSSSPGFEYEKLSKALINAIKEMPNPQVGLVNISNGLKEVELTKSQAGLTR
jgi:hypothetical protein